MCNRMKTRLFNALVLAGAFALSHVASAGRVILNNDEWTFTDYGFSVAAPSTTTFAANLASFMNKAEASAISWCIPAISV